MMTSVIAVLSVDMMLTYILLSAFSLSGTSARCNQHSKLFITTPQTIEALSGSCLLIPCNFSATSDYASNIETFGVWIKNNDKFGTNTVFHSDGTVNKYNMNLTGNMYKRNCTTLFSNFQTTYAKKYYFRIENSKFKATAVCDPVEITVKDSPPSPMINVPGELKEKESVTITCSAFTPCPHSPPKLNWNLQKDSHSNLEEKTDGTFTAQMQESITLTDKHDGFNITCSATYPVNDKNTTKKTQTLSVLYSPKNTTASMSPPGLVPAGTTVNLTCSSRAKPSVTNFTWFKISTDGPSKVYEGDFYSFNVTEGGVYYCMATNKLGNGASPKVKVSIRDEGLASTSFKWEAVLGGVIGIMVVICLAVLVWHFKSEGPTPQEPQIQTGARMSVKQPAIKTDAEESIHYVEIYFSNVRQGPPSDRGPQQDTVYAEVRGSDITNNRTQAADSSKDLYAQVRKNTTGQRGVN